MTAIGHSVPATLIAGGLVLDPASGLCERRDILVRGGAIVAVEPPGAMPRDAAAKQIDASDKLILSGLINAHTHGHANLLKGIADRWPLEVSLTHGAWMSGGRDTETIYLSTLLGAIEMVMKGCTACYDLVYEFPCPSAAGLMAVAQAYADIGMRAVLAPMIADRSLFEAVPVLAGSLPVDLGAAVADFRLAPATDIFQAMNDVIAMAPSLPPGIGLAIAPTIPHHCGDDFLTGCRDLARKNDLPLHMHLAESRLQAVAGQRIYGASLTRHLADLDMLSPRFTAAHGVWLDDDDLDLLADAGASVAHIPASNFRLGSGLADIRPMLDRGITVGLATDGANSSDSLDMFAAMRLASYVSRGHAVPRESWLSSTEALTLATSGGAAILGQSENLGRIAPAYRADLLFLDLNHLSFLPLNDAFNQIVNCDAASALTDVMVDGRYIMQGGKIAFDLTGLRERVQAAMAGMNFTTSPSRILADRLEPHVAAFAWRMTSEGLPISRHVGGAYR